MKIIIGILAISVAVLAWFVFNPSTETNDFSLGSVVRGSEYHATTTAPNTSGFADATNPLLITSSAGTFGSYIVTTAGSAGGTVNFYNATTTNRLKRTGQVATTTILITSLPTNLAAGTYTFDTQFSTALLMETTGTVGTSTITWRE